MGSSLAYTFCVGTRLRHGSLFFSAILILAFQSHAEITFNQLRSLGAGSAVGVGSGELTLGSDGAFYGATSGGSGTFIGGSVFRLDSAGRNPQPVARFQDIQNGTTSQSRLVYGSDGGLYVFYHTVGSSTDGGLARVDPATGAFQKLLTPPTRTWTQMLEASDGWLYAIAAHYLVRVDKTGAGFKIIHTNQTSSFGPGEPTLLIEGKDGRLYVTDRSGGDSSRGLIYSLNKDGSDKLTLVDFNQLSWDMGSNPHQLIYGSDGMLYGVAVSLNSTGGFPTLGSPIFQLNPATKDYTVIARLENFAVTLSSGATLREGGEASAFLEGQDGLLYGATTSGSTNHAGLAFKVARDGSGMQTLLTFPNAFVFFDTGAGVYRYAQKALAQAQGGHLVGSVVGGNDIFSFLTNGTAFAVTSDLEAAANDGRNPSAGLSTDGQGLLYGAVTRGSSREAGGIFKLRADGSDFTWLRSFPSVSDGGQPQGGVMVATDGKLYGTAYTDGAQGFGTVFRLDKDGQNYSVLRSFQGTNADGRFPSAPLLEASDGLLYGTTVFGGGAAAGTVFKLSKDGSDYQALHRFTNNASGANPSGRLLEGVDGRLYGVAETNGPGGQGVVFALGKSGTGFILLKNFSTASGLRKPQGALVQGPDAALYGTAHLGGTSGFGGVFRVNPDGTGYTVLREFSATDGDGRSPSAGLTFGPDGMLYGVTRFGGGAINGSLFRLNTDGSGYEKLRAFSGTSGDGANPAGTLLLGNDGSLYGTTVGGGTYGAGTIFKVGLPPLTPALSISVASGSLAIEWPENTGFALEMTSDLRPPIKWMPPESLPERRDGKLRLVVTPTEPRAYYRLRK